MAVLTIPYTFVNGLPLDATQLNANFQALALGVGSNVANNTLSNVTAGAPVLIGGSIDGAPIGASTPSTGKFTNLTATGVVTLPSTVNTTAGSIVAPATGSAQLANGTMAISTLANATVAPSFAHAVSRPAIHRFRDRVSLRDWDDTCGTGYDDTAAINNALSDLLYTGYTLLVPPPPNGSYLVSQSGSDGSGGYCIYNPGVSMEGQGLIGGQFKAATSVASTCDIMRVQPPGGGYIDFFHLNRLAIQPMNGATIYGRRGIFLNFASGVTNCNKMLLENLYVYKCNNLALYGLNNATNMQGVPFAGVVRDCAFFSGVDFEYFADSLCFEGTNVIRDANGFVGLTVLAQTGLISGTAGGVQLNGLNIDATGGAVYVRAGRGVSLNNCDLEMSAGSCTSVVNIAGDVSALVDFSMVGTTVGIFGTASATNIVSVGAVNSATIDQYALISAPTGGGFTQPTNAINISSSATSVYVGTGEITYNVTNQVLDAGVGTRGVLKSLTSALATGFTNIGSGYASAACMMDKNGRVKLTGWLANSTVASGNPVLTLPVGFRPPTNASVYAGYGTVGGGSSLLRFDVFTTGVVQYAAVGMATQLSLDTIEFDTQSWLTGNA